MSSHPGEFDATRQLCAEHINLIACYGIHPWYSHLFSVEGDPDKKRHYSSVIVPPPDDQFIARLPAAVPLEDAIGAIKALLDQDSSALVGEIGLDRAFRIPDPDTKKLTQYTVTLEHQVHVYTALLQIAKQFSRPVSIHGVKSHNELLTQTTKILKDSDVRIDLHSFGGSIETAVRWYTTFKKQVYFSFSYAINGRRERQLTDFLRNCGIPATQFLTESDSPKWGSDTISDLRRVCDIMSHALASRDNCTLEQVARLISLKNIETFLASA
ncbi:hypothetical protein CANCADRAFT_148369 [Tortispora caseinolytica NRRL Y-17796]|uniref:TatD related DNase n=1 Tax=Tortispora caseinolytica NRRL Y-17796 TaxID=767744 RepID=A0A1E4TAM2_9ASCO|nr:hypothetical protein CANCADRAFT_148369 [Tortispora caseinolytica NRRL Y-17796]